MKTEVEVLEQIHNSVKTTHWIQRLYAGYQKRRDGSFDESKECHCLAGHINVACDLPAALLVGTQLTEEPEGYELEAMTYRPERAVANRVGRRVWAAIKEHNPRTRATAIEAWNDRRITTREDVLTVVKIALKAAKKDAKKVAA